MIGLLQRFFGRATVEAQAEQGPVLRGNQGTVYDLATLGVDGAPFTTFAPEAVFKSDRYRELDFRARYHRNRQHDHKIFDAQGRFRPSGRCELSQPLIGGSLPSTYVPLDQRRPNAPYRLARTVVKRFTSLVFGHGHWPTIHVEGDEAATDFVRALAEEAQVQSAFVRARNKGGGRGTAVISWRYFEGKPRVKVHNAEHLVVHAWADREELVVEHASEIYQSVRDEYDPAKKKVERVTYWHRRDWTPNADLVFCEVQADDKAPEWIVDEEQSCVHGDGFAHFVWIQNQAPDDDAETADGLPDLDGQWEALDSIDALSTVLNTGTIRNLDPTLLLKLPLEMVKGFVLKGSDNAIKLGETGDAKYLELSGTAATAGLALRDKERQQILEVASCVIADPNEIAAAATSGRAIEMIFAPMLSECSVLRTQYGKGIVQLFGQMLRSARRFYPAQNGDGEWEYPVDVEVEEREEGAVEIETPVDFYLDLPPRIEEQDELDDEGKPTGKKTREVIERHPGSGSHLRLEWPAYFPPTQSDQQAAVTTLQAANGARPVFSQRTTVELAAVAFGRDAAEEQRRLDEEQQRAREAQNSMFLPGGAEANDEGDEELVTVNALRRRMGDGPLLLPDGTPDPDGALPVVQFKAKRLAAGQAAGAVVGQAEGEAEAALLSPSSTQRGGLGTGSEQAADSKPAAGGTLGVEADKLVHSVNELRERTGDGPLLKRDGRRDPDGDLPAVMYEAKVTAIGEAAGEQVTSAQKPSP